MIIGLRYGKLYINYIDVQMFQSRPIRFSFYYYLTFLEKLLLCCLVFLKRFDRRNFK
jgi:hypothetical protein